jgi:hypothetical protein
MNAGFHCRKILLLAAFVWLAPLLSAQDGLKGALSHVEFGTPFGQMLVVADLDGDNQTDGAILMDAKQNDAQRSIRIQLHLTGHENTELNFESAGRPVSLRAWDIDHDGDIDLVVEDAITHRPVYVWINEGHGDFHAGRVQDYPSLALAAPEQLQLPLNRPDCLPLWVPPQRGFDMSLMTVHLFGRPPSTSGLLALPITSSATSLAHAPYSSRAPPLLS